jgi:hypothetical protein
MSLCRPVVIATEDSGGTLLFMELSRHVGCWQYKACSTPTRQTHAMTVAEAGAAHPFRIYCCLARSYSAVSSHSELVLCSSRKRTGLRFGPWVYRNQLLRLGARRSGAVQHPYESMMLGAHHLGLGQYWSCRIHIVRVLVSSQHDNCEYIAAVVVLSVRVPPNGTRHSRARGPGNHRRRRAWDKTRPFPRPRHTEWSEYRRACRAAPPVQSHPAMEKKLQSAHAGTPRSLEPQGWSVGERAEASDQVHDYAFS